MDIFYATWLFIRGTGTAAQFPDSIHVGDSADAIARKQNLLFQFLVLGTATKEAG